VSGYDYRLGLIHSAPRGERLPISCTYPYSRGKPRAEEADLPAGWSIDWISSEDPEGEIEEAGFNVAVTFIGEREDGSTFVTSDPEAGNMGFPIGAFLFLRNRDDEIVATWDEGRWWTPEESNAFALMLQVPATFGLGKDAPRPKDD
jgi:hypothetical protein